MQVPCYCVNALLYAKHLLHSFIQMGLLMRFCLGHYTIPIKTLQVPTAIYVLTLIIVIEDTALNNYGTLLVCYQSIMFTRMFCVFIILPSKFHIPSTPATSRFS